MNRRGEFAEMNLRFISANISPVSLEVSVEETLRCAARDRQLEEARLPVKLRTVLILTNRTDRANTQQAICSRRIYRRFLELFADVLERRINVGEQSQALEANSPRYSPRSRRSEPRNCTHPPRPSTYLGRIYVSRAHLAPAGSCARDHSRM